MKWCRDSLLEQFIRTVFLNPLERSAFSNFLEALSPLEFSRRVVSVFLNFLDFPRYLEFLVFLNSYPSLIELSQNRALGAQHRDLGAQKSALGTQNRVLRTLNRALGARNKAPGVQNTLGEPSVVWPVFVVFSSTQVTPAQCARSRRVFEHPGAS